MHGMTSNQKAEVDMLNRELKPMIGQKIVGITFDTVSIPWCAIPGLVMDNDKIIWLLQDDEGNGRAGIEIMDAT